MFPFDDVIMSTCSCDPLALKTNTILSYTVNNLAADDLATQRTIALFQCTISRLIVRSRKVSKARDRVSKCLYRFEI